MDQYIPLQKRSKREQKAFHSLSRRDWHGVNPVTRVFPDGKKFDRKKVKAEARLTMKEFGWAYYLLIIPETVMLKGAIVRE